MEKYPLDPELRLLRQDIQLRAKFDDEEQQDERAFRRKKFRVNILRASVLVGVVLIILLGLQSYFNWFQARVAEARQLVEVQLLDYQVNAKLTNANAYLNAYRPEEAAALLQEVEEEEPNLAGLAEAKQRLVEMQDLEASYNAAMEKKNAGDLLGALTILQELEKTNPGYRDVTLQAKDIQRQYLLTDNIQLADDLVAEGKWVEAIARYEEVRSFDPTYQQIVVEERLFNSYLNGAQYILDTEPESLDALLKAQDYFTRALSLRPQNKEVIQQMEEARKTVGDRLYNYFIQLVEDSLLGQADSLTVLQKVDEYLAAAQSLRPDDQTLKTQRELSKNFVLAQDDFIRSRWDDAISKLEFVYQQDAGFANGTARQALYDAYILRGDVLLRSGKTQRALEDYQNAVRIAELTPEARFRLFEAQVKIGDVMGIMGNQQGAVYQYRAALDEANLTESVILDPELALAVANAEGYASRGSYSYAYSLYNGAMDLVAAKFQTLTHVVEEGDYLAKLANLYATTVSAILKANDLSDPSQLKIGERIIIPVIP
jgi:tetratricopeptide (TPR) repeat protein